MFLKLLEETGEADAPHMNAATDLRLELLPAEVDGSMVVLWFYRPHPPLSGPARLYGPSIGAYKDPQPDDPCYIVA